MTLIKRDRDVYSPTYGEDLDAIPILDDTASSGVCLLKGFSGLYHAPRTHVKETGAYQEGVTLSDFPRVDERIIDLRIATKGTSAVNWEETDSHLWEILTFREDAVLRVESASVTRELNVRLERKPADQMDFIPGQVRHMVWAVTLIACDPWWYSSTLESTWVRGTTPLVDGAYHGTVTVANYADQECWLEWAGKKIVVPEQWTLPDGVALYPYDHADAGDPITHPLPLLGVDKDFLVQTHPLQETLQVMDDSLMWAAMKAEEFVFPLKRRTEPTVVPVKLVGGNAASQISVFMVQRWDRPWGGQA